MNPDRLPNIPSFLAAPNEVVAAVAPATAIYASGGTRRRAVIENVPLDEAYVTWTRKQIVPTAATFFRLGIQHLFIPLAGQRQFEETGFYRDQLANWIAQSFSADDMIEDYQRHGWRVRLIALSSAPALSEAAAYIERATRDGDGPTLWLYVVSEYAAHFGELIRVIHHSGATTQQEAIRAMYGVDVPPATLYIGFGRTMIGTSLTPPLLLGDNLHCYWTLRAGFAVTETMLRRIIYDYAYNRATWAVERSFRYADAAQQRILWDSDYVIGVGKRVGGFWYPDGVIDAEQQRSVGETNE